MPRKPRLDAPGLIHHVIVRGIERRDIFIDDADRREFLRRVGALAGGKNNQIYAFCLMPNHVHILVRTLSMPLAKFMSRLLTGYALYFNKRHKRVGHLFQNRYKSIVVDEEIYLLELIRYIHLNPLRAGIVKEPDALAGWPYAGHATLMGKVKLPWYGIDQTLSLFGSTYAAARIAITEFMADSCRVQDGLSGGGLAAGGLSGGGLRRSMALMPPHDKQGRLACDERILGVGDFVESLLSSLERCGNKGGTQEHAQEQLDRFLVAVAEHHGLSLAELLSGSRRKVVAQARAAAVWYGARRFGMSTTELARALGIARAAVCSIIRSGKGEDIGHNISIEE